MTRGLIEAPIKITDKNFKEIKENETEKIGYLGKYKEVPNFTEEEVDILKNIWTNMIEKNLAIAIHPDWYSFEQFLKDIKFVPQYFLAREDNFLGWELNKDYYYSDLYSKDTCVFLQSQEIDFMAKTGCRFELSRNQIVELIKDIQNNPYGRRHIISFWHWANIDKKSLVECAYETIWNVRGEYLDMSLIQRSGDMLTASGPGGINEVQYAALLMMIARHTGYTPGIFTHFVANEQIYDRHIEAAKEISKRFTSLETTKECPKMILNPEKNNFFEFTIDDFTLENYNPIKPQLKLELGI